MNKWYWIICPKCGGMNDSDFLDFEFKEKDYENAEDFKKTNTGISINCSDCGRDTFLDLCMVETDDEV